MRRGLLCLVVQVHSAELESLKGSIAQKDKESSVMQAQMERLQNQLADRSSHVSSLNLKTAQQSNNIVVKVLLQA